MVKEYLRLGEILVKDGIITQPQLEKAISAQKQEGGRLGEVLLKLGIVTEEQLVSTLGKQLGIPYISLGTGMLKPATNQNLEELIPVDTARRNLVLPLSRTLNSLTIALTDPLDLPNRSAISRLLAPSSFILRNVLSSSSL